VSSSAASCTFLVIGPRWWQHLVEEYARHNGHADLIREVIDGSAGL
jgi:hypothetical protein